MLNTNIVEGLIGMNSKSPLLAVMIKGNMFGNNETLSFKGTEQISH
jgi:hypothetical protein